MLLICFKDTGEAENARSMYAKMQKDLPFLEFCPRIKSHFTLNPRPSGQPLGQCTLALPLPEDTASSEEALRV